MKPLCLDAALEYLRRGWSSFPLCPRDHVGVGKEHAKLCDSPGKVPLLNWKPYQSRLPQEAELQLLFRRHPNANVGVALGQVSGLVGIDVDGPAARATGCSTPGRRKSPARVPRSSRTACSS